MMQRTFLFKTLIFFFGLATFAFAQKVDERFGDDFFLRDGDVYVIYGDSITNNAVYPRLLENYVLTRFPSWQITFYNLGWGGDIASNLFRLTRDVLPLKPTVFTENMGMNDGRYRPIHQDTVDRYTNAYREMIPMLRAVNPRMRIALISAVPYENQPTKYAANGAYPQTLRYLSRVKRQIACEFDTAYIDLFSGYAREIGAGKVIYPDFITSGDGIHPNIIGQTIMGMVILQGMNAPGEIARLDLNIEDQIVNATQTGRCRVRDMKVSQEGIISFDRMAEALPCPVEPQSEKARRFLDLAGFSDKINRDILRVTGLTDKAYELKMNDVSIAVYTVGELAEGVNIAEPMKGPLWDQAMAVARATADRQKAHYTKWRTVWLKDQSNMTKGEYDLGDKAKIEQLDVQAQLAIQRQHELNQPRWTTFTLTPVAKKTIVLPEPVTLAEASPLRPARMVPLDWTKKDVKTFDLRKLTNRAFADEIAWDGRGGWSDQGPKVNLGAIPLGMQTFSGIPFDIIDPTANDGKSMIVIGTHPKQKNLNAEVVIPFGRKAKVLTFLHAGAWYPGSAKPVEVEFSYPNDIRITTQFVPGHHFADWWGPPKWLPNGIVAWEGKSNGGPIGVMYTPVVNPQPELPIESIRIFLQEGSGSVYGLLAMSYLE